MRAITSVGEIVASVGDKDYLFRPSLAAMDSLGSPTEIVEKFVLMHTPHVVNTCFPKEAYRAWERDVIATAMEVLRACCNDDITDLVGYAGKKWGKYVPGQMPVDHMLPLARCLLKHGVVGGLPKSDDPPKQEDYSSEFHPRDYVAQAIAHLRMDPESAWRLTVTEFGAAMRAKYGKPESKTPSVKQFDADMALLDEINAMRAQEAENV